MAKKKPAKRGPKAEILKLEGNWIDNIKKSMQKPKPAAGRQKAASAD